MTDVISEPVAVEAEEPLPDLEVILPDPTEPFAIGEADGKPVLVQVNRLRTREFLALLRVLARGLGAGMKDIDFSGDDQEMQGELVAVLLMAVPEAEDEFIEFMRRVVVPVGRSDDEIRLVALALRNPAIEDTLAVAERVAVQEAADLRRLVGKAQAMWGTVSKVYRSQQSGG